jgi:hypothetical protein
MANIGHQGAVEGQVFDGRAAIHEAGLHLHTMRGISGRGNGPAEAIVLSGGYVDDVDLGDEIIYTGEGGRDSQTRQQVSDQTLSDGTRRSSIAASMEHLYACFAALGTAGSTGMTGCITSRGTGRSAPLAGSDSDQDRRGSPCPADRRSEPM